MSESITVLVVDNEANFAELTATMLEREDDRIEATGVTSGDEALAVIDRSSVDCIVSDYDMPEMNGLELLEAVRSRDSAVPFILFTGKGSEEIASEAIAAGVTQYLQKRPGGDRFTLLANQVTNAVAQYRTETELRESERRYERTLRTLHETTRDLMRAGTKDEMYQAAVDTAQTILEVPIVAAYRFEPVAGTLTHVVSTAETSGTFSPAETIERGEGIIWEAFSEGEHRYQADRHAIAAGEYLDLGTRSELVVPLGTHGVIVAGSERGDGFDESMQELLSILGANTEAALDRAEREQLLREHDRTLTEQNEELTRLNHTNEIVRAINRGVAQATTRQAIETRVCERLADADRYLCAWVVSSDRVETEPTEWAGIDVTFIDQVREEGEQAPERGLIERALETRSVTVVENVLDQPGWDGRRKAALTYGYQTVIAVPLVGGDREYGAVVIHAPRADAVSESEREVLDELGETIGHAIRSVERTQAMVADSRVELELECTSDRLLFNRLGDSIGADLELEGIIDRTAETVLFVSVNGSAGESLLETPDQWAAIESVSVVSDDAEPMLFEITTRSTPFVEILREYDARVTAATTAGGTTSVTLSVPGRIDVRSLVEAVQEQYPETELTAQRQSDPDRSGMGFDARLEDRLTEKQHEALQAAHYSGFFAWPRDSTGEDLAAALEVTPPTYHYHLRAAQRKLVSLVFDGGSN